MPNGRRRVSAPVLIGSVVVLGLVFVAALGVWNHGRNAYWWGTSDRMRILLDDPLASTTLLGLTLLRHDQTEPVGVLGKPAGDFVTNVFAADVADLQQTQADIVAEAQRVGWSPNPGSSSPLSQNLSRSSQGAATLLVSVAPLAPGDDPVTGNRAGVRVALSYA